MVKPKRTTVNSWRTIKGQSNHQHEEKNKMKNTFLYLVGIMALGILGFGGVQAEAASGNIGWSQKLKCDTLKSCPRFVVLKAWENLAVLDKETGLVWEQTLDTTTRNWANAHNYCNTLVVSNRMGWRLPTFQELAGLIDRSQSSPVLPFGHPFSNVVGSIADSLYWTATASASNSLSAWTIRFIDSESGPSPKTNTFYVWCVRGGSGVDAQ
jgi:hypothetical protein